MRQLLTESVLLSLGGAGIGLLLGGIALLACYIPARCATAADPVAALCCD